MHQILKTGAVLAIAASALFISPPVVEAQIPTAVQTPAQNDKPFLHPLFTSNMVLQRGIAAPVWGWAAPGQKVRVTLSGASARVTSTTATAGADGKWMAKVGPYKAGGPYTLTVTGPQSVTLTNVMFGDVWLCSGQSNMRMGMTVIGAPAEIAAANYPNIRLFSVAKNLSLTPRDVVSGQWDVCTPQTIVGGGKDSWGGFSAAAYFFGRNLHQQLNVPIGLIHSSWGGTNAEAWATNQSLKTIPDFASVVSQLEAQAGEPNGEDFDLLMTNWWQKNDPGTVSNWQHNMTVT
ncbi:MAG TPA: sialate O-acetylesterase, partial [Abditibacteriaceae bacterium]